ncbi:MAG TPA: glycosyltransferase family 2 protein [Polyangia bacterium]
MKPAKLVIVTPAYQAARHLPALLSRVHAVRFPATLQTELVGIVVVDDGSRDETFAVASAWAANHPLMRVHRRAQNGGYGAAMQDGLAAARALGATCVACVHADGQYSPEALPGLLTAMAERGLDLVQGSRIAGGQALAGGMPFYKYVGNAVLNRLENRAFGLAMTDYHSGYLIYGPRVLTEIPFERLSHSFDFDLEVIASARARGMAVGEAPIPTHYGDEVSHLDPLAYGLRVLRVLWRYQRGHYGTP